MGEQITAKLKNGEQICYTVYNPECLETIIMVHGNLSDQRSWARLIEPLQKSPFRIITYDQRGFGKSSYENEVQKIEDLSQDLCFLCDEIQVDKVILCGWSLGGIVVLQFAADFPERVKGVVLIASGHVEGFPLLTHDNETFKSRRVNSLKEVVEHPKIIFFLGILKNMNKTFLKSICIESIFNGIFNPSIDCEELDIFIDGSMCQRNYPEVAFALSQFNMTAQGSNAIAKIDCPVLIYHGEKDLVVEPCQALSNAKQLGIKRCKVIMKKDIGHCPPYDNPNDLSQEIVSFCTEDLKL